MGEGKETSVNFVGPNGAVRPMSSEELEIWMEADARDRARYALNDDDLAPLVRYVEHGIEPGSFLTAVLENDLAEACARADMHNRRKLYEWVYYIYNECPGECWGSPEKVEAWIKKKEEEFKNGINE